MIKLFIDAIFFSDRCEYPRTTSGPMNIDAVLEEMHQVTLSLPQCNEKKEMLLAAAKNSLDEVKALTEYQDEKASRLLTIIAFLMAGAVGLFTKFVDIFPLMKYRLGANFGEFVVVAGYVNFAIFGFLSIGGAFLIFAGTQTRFLWGGNSVSAEADTVKSRLFFRQIIATKPKIWAESFGPMSEEAIESDVFADKILDAYYSNYVKEAYLVASKVAEKLRYIEPAQLLLRYSILALIIWSFMVALAFGLSNPKGKDFESAIRNNEQISDNSSRSTDRYVQKDTTVGPTHNNITIEVNSNVTGAGPAQHKRNAPEVKNEKKTCICLDGCGQHPLEHQCSLPDGAK